MKTDKQTQGPMLPLYEPRLQTYNYDQLYEEYYPQLLGGFTRLLGTADVHFEQPQRQGTRLRNVNLLAEDLAQDTMLRVWEYWNQIKWDSVRSLISLVGIHLYIDYRRGSNNNIDARKDDDDPTVFLEQQLSGEYQGMIDPRGLLQNARMISKVVDAIEIMKPVDQVIFTRIFFNGESPQEVADELGLNYPTLRKRLQRARKLLGERDE